MPKLEAVFNEELAKVLKEGFTEDEIAKAKQAWLEQRRVSRAEDSSIASTLLSRERWERTMLWDEKLEAAVSALTARQVNEALRRHLDPAALSIVKGGDFKKSGAYQ
jgi:zinc protease